MQHFWSFRRARAFWAMRRRFESYDVVDAYAEEIGAADWPTERTYLQVSAFGFRAEAQGKTGFAALKVMREQYPVVVHVLYTYLAVMGLLSVLALSTFLPR
ncbi:hypothetical protein ABR738_14450 [Streptomyces sp. Edi4]|uniref:hypothetical protein n=1 Tax=Streptomyces sp. Edi4 TaxID=3162527 RepID=UPI003305F765